MTHLLSVYPEGILILLRLDPGTGSPSAPVSCPPGTSVSCLSPPVPQCPASLPRCSMSCLPPPVPCVLPPRPRCLVWSWPPHPGASSCLPHPQCPVSCPHPSAPVSCLLAPGACVLPPPPGARGPAPALPVPRVLLPPREPPQADTAAATAAARILPLQRMLISSSALWVRTRLWAAATG